MYIYVCMYLHTYSDCTRNCSKCDVHNFSLPTPPPVFTIISTYPAIQRIFIWKLQSILLVVSIKPEKGVEKRQKCELMLTLRM